MFDVLFFMRKKYAKIAKTDIVLRILILLFLAKVFVFFSVYHYLFAQFTLGSTFFVFLKLVQSDMLIIGLVFFMLYMIKKIRSLQIKTLLLFPLIAVALFYLLDLLALVIFQQRFSFSAIH